MKKIYILIILLMTLQLVAQTPPGSWDLVWEDNFDGNHLDSEKWKMGVHWLGIGGSHLFANSGKSIIVENGLLTMRAEKRTEIFAGVTKGYASAEISTFKQFRQKYGYYEARIKYDAIKGVWPAFWMMPDRGVPQPGPWYADARSYIKFDINSLNAQITSAIFKVKIMPQTEVDADHNISIHKIIDNSTWTESNITWNNKPMSDAAFLKQFMGTTNAGLINQIVVGEYIEVDVTDYINAQISGSKQFAGFALMAQFMKQKRVEFGSKENGGITNRPVLVIDGTNIYPSDDAMVRITDPDIGFGDQIRLHVCDRWANTSKTDNEGMEMDIMESLGVWGDNKLQHALHWDNYGADHKTINSGQFFITSTPDSFHTYGMEWSEGEMKFYVDGVHTWTHTNARVSTVESYMILSHQVGGWGGSGNTPVADGNLPADMVVDYVKVYENSTLAVDSFSDDNNFSLNIAPNPIKEGNLTFILKKYSVSENVKVTIADILGRVIYSSSITSDTNGEMNIQLEKMNFKRGIYILQVKGENLLLAKKFIY
jgi:beta-glucanase (GH16 family)